MIVSDLGIGQNGEQGALHIWHGSDEGEFTPRRQRPRCWVASRLISTDDLNGDGTREITLVMEGCTTFCTTRVHVLEPLSGR